MQWSPDRGGTVEAIPAVNDAHDKLKVMLGL
jgi:hypothetical protein